MSAKKFIIILSASAGTLERVPAEINFSADIDVIVSLAVRAKPPSNPITGQLSAAGWCPLIGSKKNPYHTSDQMVKKIPKEGA